MPSYHLHVRDGKQARIMIEAANTHEAVNDSVNALAEYAFRNFPPPENISISISDENHRPVAVLRLAFEIEWAAKIVA
jgi:hypothetical protein